MEKEKNGDGENKGKRIVVRLPVSSLAVILFLSAAAISLAYVGGVMSGRHSVTVAPVEGTAIESPETVVKEESEQKVLAPEELEFARALRGVKPRAEKSSTSLPVPPVAPSANAPAPPLPEAPAAGVPAPENVLTDYVFQMGAFKDDAGADGLREKLEGYGLRTKLQKDGKMRVVLVLLRGSPERAEEVVQIARALKLGDPVERSRKIVDAPR